MLVWIRLALVLPSGLLLLWVSRRRHIDSVRDLNIWRLRRHNRRIRSIHGCARCVDCQPMCPPPRRRSSEDRQLFYNVCNTSGKGVGKEMAAEQEETERIVIVNDFKSKASSQLDKYSDFRRIEEENWKAPKETTSRSSQNAKEKGSRS